MRDLILRVVNNGTSTALDVDTSIPLRLDISAIDNTRIGTNFGIGSQTFVLPGTKTNNQFFKHAYNVGVLDIPALYEFIQCYVLLDGEVILEGKLRLEEIITDEMGYVSYKVNIIDQSIDFIKALENKFINDADWSAYDHLINKENIVASWSDDLLSGSVFYPLADYGTDGKVIYPIQPRIQISGDQFLEGSIDNPTSPIRLPQFLPAIKLKAVMDVVFAQAGFNYTSSFIESTDFDKLFILPKAQEDLGIVTETEKNANFEAYASADQTEGISTNYVISASIETLDPTDSYNTSSMTYIIPTVGDYSFQGQVGFMNPVASGGSAQLQVALYLVIDPGTGNPNDGIVLATDTLLMDGSTGDGPHYLSVAYTDAFDPGVKLRLQGYVEQYTGAPALDTTFLQEYTEFKALDTPVILEDAVVNMGLQFDAQTKSLDIIKGIIQQFNLVFSVDKNSPKTLKIEPFDQWMYEGDEVDWTDKIDNAQRISIKHPILEQERTLTFKNTDDVDRLSKISIDNFPNFQYGTLRAISDSDIPQGERTIEATLFGPVILAPTIISGSQDPDGTTNYNLSNNRMAIPHLYKLDNKDQKSFKFKTRIGYKVSPLSPSGAALGKIYIGTEPDYVESTFYATLSNYSDLGNLFGTALTANNLHFDDQYNVYIDSLTAPLTSTTAFTDYWKNYIDGLYWQEGRKIVADIYFTPEEYKDIDLNDKILIKDQIYRINNISGFNLQEPDVVTVELLKYYPVLNAGEYTPAPTPGPAPSPTPTPTPTPAPCTTFLAGPTSNFDGVCEAIGSITYSHNGAGAYPTVGDTMYLGDECGGVAVAGYYYMQNGDWVRVVGGGEVIQVGTCL